LTIKKKEYGKGALQAKNLKIEGKDIEVLYMALMDRTK